MTLPYEPQHAHAHAHDTGGRAGHPLGRRSWLGSGREEWPHCSAGAHGTVRPSVPRKPWRVGQKGVLAVARASRGRQVSPRRRSLAETKAASRGISHRHIGLAFKSQVGEVGIAGRYHEQYEREFVRQREGQDKERIIERDEELIPVWGILVRAEAGQLNGGALAQRRGSR
jgi:hypothetical protein